MGIAPGGILAKGVEDGAIRVTGMESDAVQ
jgi:hypothetical protein